MAEGRIVEVMLHHSIGPKKRPSAIIITYRLSKLGKPTVWKTLTLTGAAECSWYEWQSEVQALDEHRRAVAHYRRMS